MARKKPPEEKENLERYLVSYADFMTLMFATFVVLYALAQADSDAFKNIEEALKHAFSQSIFEANKSILDGDTSVFEQEQMGNNPIMLEYMSQKYEQSSFEEIEEEINKMNKDGLEASIEDRGLVIRLNEKILQFESSSANLPKKSLKILDEVAKIIKRKFSIHYIQIEGHSDSDKLPLNSKFPSNWELSSARACSVVRYLQNTHNFHPKIFSALGLADTVPLAPNTNNINKAKNRRVEIVILKNKNKNLSNKNLQEIMKEVQDKQLKEKYIKTPSRAIEELIKGDEESLKNVIDMSKEYENETKRLNSMNKSQYDFNEKKPDFME